MSTQDKQAGVTVTLESEVARRAFLGALWNDRLYSQLHTFQQTVESVPPVGFIGERWGDAFEPVQAIVSVLRDIERRVDDVHALQETGLNVPTQLHCSAADFLRALDHGINEAKEILDTISVDDLQDACDQILALMRMADQLRERGVEYKQAPVALAAIGGDA